MPRKTAKTTKQKTAAEQVEEQLARYRAMRHFDKTAEPAGGAVSTPSADQLPFVVQKHAATRLHYDFRLGWYGVLKSWAVTKGPSYVVADKRLAVQVEDHPMEYGGFEGVIPKGEYGGGTVMLWDEGTWQPHGNVDEDLARGQMKFTLHGTKLKGAWVLVRMGGKAARESKPNWLLIKEHDHFERTAEEPAIIDEAPNSVVTGRDFPEIAAEKDHTWNSHASAKQAKASIKTKFSRPAKVPQLELADAPPESFPDFISPALAYQSDSPPTGGEWVHELKLDGYRIQAHLKSQGKDGELSVRLLTRNGLDWTHRMSDLAARLAKMAVKDAILDGEVAVTNESGITSFAALQSAFQDKNVSDLLYFVFDVLHLNGKRTRDLPLLQRKKLAASLVESLDDEVIRLSEHFETDGSIMLQEACKLGAEGIVSKLTTSTYTSGRSRSWQKIKCVLEQEFVIGGYTLPGNGSAGVGAILVGYYEGKALRYGGKTGTGFTQKSSQQLRKQLDKIARKSSPFAAVPADVKRSSIWVTPELVAQIQFRAWTTDGLIRQSAFQGLREDKPAVEVVREKSISQLQAKPEEEVIPKQDSGVGESKLSPSFNYRLTHPERIIDAESGLTKQQLAEYYFEIAPHILPHVEGRPLSIIRCPNGSGSKCFFQRHLSSSLPKGVGGVDVPNKDGKGAETYITLSSAEALVGLAQMNVIELHPWSSKNDDIEHPDRLIFDLDPDPTVSWTNLRDAALEVRDRLKKIGLESFVKVTGGKGLHIVAPIKPQHDWPAIKSFAHAFVLKMEAENPRLYLTKMIKAARKEKIYLDYLRNERGATAVAPYSPRARAGIPASVPLAWSELKAGSLPRFRVVDFSKWKSRTKKDPWIELATIVQTLNMQS
jgi:bifunctional non-homologous end joining protein LigD